MNEAKPSVPMNDREREIALGAKSGVAQWVIGAVLLAIVAGVVFG